MSELKFCQGPECHTYYTKDRLRGPKGNKTYQTRRRSNFYYLGGNACSTRCQDDWFQKFGDQAVDHFGRIHEPKRQDASGAWYKDCKYNYNNGNNSYNDHFFVNDLLGQRIPITEQQYNDKDLVRP